MTSSPGLGSLELVIGRLSPVPGLENEALDPYLARIDPYRASVRQGDDHALEVIVTNHAPTARETSVRLRLPADWQAQPAEAAATVPPDGSSVRLRFSIRVPADALRGRVVLTADVDLGGEPRGELAETLLEVVTS